jgi:hypothetical protein
MVLMATLLLVGALGLPLLVVLALRAWGTDTARTESSLLSPQAHTVAFVVPEGEDPTYARAALTHAGFVSALDRSGDQRLVVRCEPGQREQVREILERVDHRGRLVHVLFDDESG